MIEGEYANGTIEKMVDFNADYTINDMIPKLVNKSFLTILIDPEPIKEFYPLDAERNRMIERYNQALDQAIAKHGVENKVFRLSAVRQTIRIP